LTAGRGPFCEVSTPPPAKTAAGRRLITLPAVAMTALVAHLDRYSTPGPDGLVF